ncbi:DUF3298 and DUF4163 domain-containing protein [Oscillibacter sp. MSJ-31]|uniref:DUF3298 and DUF4163 domain-containing protein n=1 Tax=Oscillibacter sp. MSJ-31 TaxID=2841526 RepID=UPI001C0F9C2B|nr:DUF3298 and DUF4163 domain-containing protein [Oscillibacter sp. MSJ-31]MBU5458704.1 DUF3298 and DUF4163 domain-containing protein [Oscillibacter sp. MSJ-31]
MRKLLSTLLALSLAQSLTACGGNGDPTGPDAPKPSQPETPELTFAVGTPLTHESTYTADDGTLLLHTNYELPQLELRTADGALYEPGAAATQSAAVAVRDAFNAEMERCYAAVLSNESELAQEARDHYGSDSMSFEYIYYEDELLGEVVYQTDGLISVLANAYAFYGGAHPNTSTLTWSFDLTTGEFLTLDALNAQSSTDSTLGKTLVDTLASEIVNRIYEEGLDDYLYDDFYSYVYDLSSNAHFYFSGSGMTVNFDAYVLGPYASGPQTFEIPYSHFYNALDAHTQSLLDVPRDEIILADYNTTQTLWSWFYQTTPPIDANAPAVMANGQSFNRVSLGEINTLDALRALLCEHVSEELADEWLSGSSLTELNDALYVLCADRGYDITIDGASYLVAWNGDSGELIQTITRRAWNDAAGNFVPVPGTETYSYPFTTVNGHAVFSAFPCPY